MREIMQIKEEHAIDWVRPTSASKSSNRVPVVRILWHWRQSQTVKYFE